MGIDRIRLAQHVDLAGRTALVVIFGVLLTIKTAALMTILQSPKALRFLDLASHIASLAFVLLVVFTTLVRLKPIRNADGIEPRISALVGTAMAAGIPYLPRADIGPSLQVTVLLSVGIGWILSTWVLCWLGRAFSIMAQARKLVTGGPYSIVRHPLYVCEQITVIGVVLAHFSIEAVVLVTVQWLFQLRRMTNEERVLRAAFPEYDVYAKGTPKVIPRLFPKKFRFGHA